jgi:HSP20 family molecular chaperone IbpA
MAMAKKMEVEKRGDHSPVEAERVFCEEAVPFDADIYERKDALVVVADLPGCDEQSVNIQVERGVLTIDGRVEAEDESDARLDFAEYRPANFRRSFTLSSKVKSDGIEATLKDGVLRVVLPKAEEVQARTIEVKTG